MIVRSACVSDAAALADLYNQLGVATTASYDTAPVDTAQRLAWLGEHQANGWPVLVADDDGAVVGFAAYSPFNPKPGYRHTVEHSVYLLPSCQGQGVGRALMHQLIAAAQNDGRHAMVGLVDAANSGSIAFHEHLGFTTVGVLPQVGRKFDQWLDVAVQVLVLISDRVER